MASDSEPPTPLPPTRRCTPPMRPTEADPPSWMPTIPSPPSTPSTPTAFERRGTPNHTVSPLLRALAAESRPDVEEAVAQIRAYPSLDARAALAAVRSLAFALTLPMDGNPGQHLAEDQRDLLCEIIVFAAHALRA